MADRSLFDRADLERRSAALVAEIVEIDRRRIALLRAHHLISEEMGQAADEAVPLAMEVNDAEQEASPFDIPIKERKKFWLAPKEAAHHVCVDETTIRRWCLRYRIGLRVGGRWHVSVARLERHLRDARPARLGTVWRASQPP